MVNRGKIIRFLPLIAFIIFVVLLCSQNREESHSLGGQPLKKTIIEMKMIPIDDSPGEFILEYSNGNKEILRKDGSRHPLVQSSK